MKIGIVGIGVVGGACKYGFEKLGHQVSAHDLRLGTTIEDVLDTQLCYIAVPTPQSEDGSCDTSIVEGVVKELIQHAYTGCIVVKSTVLPGTTVRLSELYGRDICFVPEFLRERCAVTDFTENHDLLAVGCWEAIQFDLICKSHGHYPQKGVRMTTGEAELLKYYSNTFNSLKVVFANTMYEISQKMGLSYDVVKKAFIERGTAADLYLDVNDNFRGYGGVCLPKDTSAMAKFVDDLGLDLNIFATLEAENKKFKTTVFEGMRL